MDPQKPVLGYQEKSRRGKPQLILDENGNNTNDSWMANQLNYASSMPQKTSFQFQVYNSQQQQPNNFQMNNNVQDDSRLGTNFNIEQQSQTTTNKLNKLNITNQMFRQPLTAISQQQNSPTAGNNSHTQTMQVTQKRRFNSCNRGSKKISIVTDNLLPNVQSKPSKKGKGFLNKSGQMSPSNLNQTFFTKQNSPLGINRAPLPPVFINNSQRETLGKIEDGNQPKRNKKIESEVVKKKDVRAIQYLSAYGDESIGEVIITKENLKQYLEKLNDPEGYDGRVMMKHFQEHFKMWEQRVSKIHKSLLSSILEKEFQPNTNFLKTRLEALKQQIDLEEVIESARNVQLKYQYNNNLAKIINSLIKRRDQFKQLADYLSVASEFQDGLDKLFLSKNVQTQNIESIIDQMMNQIINSGRERYVHNQQLAEQLQYDIFVDKLNPYLEKLKQEYIICKKVVLEYDGTQLKAQQTVKNANNDQGRELNQVRENVNNIISLQGKYNHILQNFTLISRPVHERLENDLSQLIFISKELDYKVQQSAQSLINQLIEITQAEFHLNITSQNWILSFKSFSRKFEQLCQLQINREKDSIEKRIAQIRISLETLHNSFTSFVELFSMKPMQGALSTKYLSQGTILIGNQECQEELQKAMQYINSFANAHGQIVQHLEYIKRKIEQRIDTQQNDINKEGIPSNQMIAQEVQSSQNINQREGNSSFNTTSRNVVNSLNFSQVDGQESMYSQQQKQHLQNYYQSFNIDHTNSDQPKILSQMTGRESKVDASVNMSQLRRSHYYYPQNGKSFSSNKNKKKIIIRGFDRANSQVNSPNSEQSTQIFSRQSNPLKGDMSLVEYEDNDRNTVISGYNSILDIKQGNQTQSVEIQNKQASNLSVLLNEESFELDNNNNAAVATKKNQDEFIVYASSSSTRQRFFSQNISQKGNLISTQTERDMNLQYYSKTNFDQEQEKRFQQDSQLLKSSIDNQMVNSSEILNGRTSQHFHQSKLKRKSQISAMRQIRAQRKFMQNLINESNQLLSKGERRDEYSDIISFNNIPPVDSLGLSGRIINILKQDIMVLTHMQRQIIELREANPFTLYIKCIDKYVFNAKSYEINIQQDNQQQNNQIYEKQNEQIKDKINGIIELMKNTILIVEKGQNLDIQYLVGQYDSDYGYLFSHIYCLVIEQSLNFTKLIQMEEIFAKCINRMIDGINFQNMSYLETIITDNFKKLEQILLLTNQYLPEQHSIVAIQEKYMILLQKLQVQNAIFYSNNSVIPNYDDLSLIIQSIQDFLYRPSIQTATSTLVISKILEDTLGIFKNAFQRFQNMQSKLFDPKSRLIIYDKIEKVIISCSNSTKYLQNWQDLSQSNANNIQNQDQNKINNSKIQSDSSVRKKQPTPQQDQKTLLSLLRRMGEYLISKNENVIIVKDQNQQIVYICKHNQIDYSNPLDKLINSSQNYIIQEETEQTQNENKNGKNYSEIYKQIVLNNKYFDSITHSKILYKQQLQNIIYNNNQYEKEGVQVLQGLKGMLLIDVDQNLQYLELFRNKQIQAQIIVYDSLTNVAIYQAPLFPNINKINFQYQLPLQPYRVQIIWDLESTIKFTDDESISNSQQLNENKLNQEISAQTFVIYEKEICICSFINTYLEIDNNNVIYSPMLPISRPPPPNQILEEQVVPSVPSIEASRSPDLDDNTHPFANADRFIHSPSPLNKRMSQDTIYQSTLKVIEEENYSSISFNNIDLLKEKDKLRYEIESKKYQKQIQKQDESYEQSGSYKTFSFAPQIQDNKEESYTQFRFLMEAKQLQVKEESQKSKNMMISKVVDQNQKKIQDLCEIAELSEKEGRKSKISTDEGRRTKKQKNEIKKKSQTLDLDIKQEDKKPNTIDVVEKEKKDFQNISISKSKTISQEQLNHSKTNKNEALDFKHPKNQLQDKPQIIISNNNNANSKQLDKPQIIISNNSGTNSKLSNRQSIQADESRASAQKQNNKEQQGRASRQTNDFGLHSHDDTLHKLNPSQNEQHPKTLTRQRKSISQKQDTSNNGSLNVSQISMKSNQNKTISNSKQQIDKKPDLLSISQLGGDDSNFQSIEQSQEYITIEQFTNLQSIQQPDHLTSNSQQSQSVKSKKFDQKDQTKVQNTEIKPYSNIISNKSEFHTKGQNSNYSSIQNSSKNSSIKNKQSSTMKKNLKKFELDENNDDRDFDENPEIKSFQGILHELKTTKINIDI